MLRVSYSSQEWAMRCSRIEVAQEWIGPIEAQALIQVIADLEALQNVADAIDFLDAEIDDAGNIKVPVSRKRIALLRSVPIVAEKQLAGINWSQVRRLQLFDIVEI